MPVESTKTKSSRVRARDQDVPTAWGVYVTLMGLGDIACRTRRAAEWPRVRAVAARDQRSMPRIEPVVDFERHMTILTGVVRALQNER
jgi:hypothetical protein